MNKEMQGTVVVGLERVEEMVSTAEVAEPTFVASKQVGHTIPSGVENSSLRTDGPFAYRDLDECLALIDDYVEPVTRYSVVGYMGHL